MARLPTLNLEGFSPVQLALTFTTTELAEMTKLPHEVLPFGVFVLIGLTLTVDPEGTGPPPVHEPKFAVTFVISFVVFDTGVFVSGGVKVKVPPNGHVVVPVPVTFLAYAVPSSNATLASGNAVAARIMMVLRIRMWTFPFWYLRSIVGASAIASDVPRVQRPFVTSRTCRGRHPEQNRKKTGPRGHSVLVKIDGSSTRKRPERDARSPACRPHPTDGLSRSSSPSRWLLVALRGGGSRRSGVVRPLAEHVDQWVHLLVTDLDPRWVEIGRGRSVTWRHHDIGHDDSAGDLRALPK